MRCNHLVPRTTPPARSRIGTIAGALALGAGILLASAPLAAAQTGAAAGGKADAAMIERGAYLSVIGHCNDCHTPFKMGPNGPEPDMSRMLSGHPADVPIPPAPEPQGAWEWMGLGVGTAFAGPWGISVARNLTPDETGLGAWTEDRFIRSMRTGKHEGGGRPILPPMPWFNVAQMTDPDIKALWAYLRSIPAIRNATPDSMPAGPPPAAPAAKR